MMLSGTRFAHQPALLLTALLTLAVNTSAAPVTLDFEGFASFEAIFDYYDAGTGHLGSGPGPDWGVVVDTGVSITSPVLANIPSPDAAMGIDAQPGNQLVMNVAGGFIGALSFSYTSENIRATLSIYAGQDGTGALLASTTLEPIYLAASLDPSTTFDTWTPVNLPFAGTAGSAVLRMTDDLQPGNGGSLNSRRSFWLDDLTLDPLAAVAPPAPPTNDPARPVPAMNSTALLLLGGLIVAVVARRQRGSARFT